MVDGSPGRRPTDHRTAQEKPFHDWIDVYDNQRATVTDSSIDTFTRNRYPPLPPLITAERPDRPDAIALITELEAHLAPLYPTESRHGYSVTKLIAQNVAFFVVRCNDSPQAAAASSFSAANMANSSACMSAHNFVVRAREVAARIIWRISPRHGISFLRLETGIHQAEAIGLYERWGFRRIGPFGGVQG